MQIEVILKGRRTGTLSAAGHYRASVVTHAELRSGNSLPFNRHPEYCRRLEELLLGQVAPGDLRISHVPRGAEGLLRDGCIVRAGETIASLHLRFITRNWYYVDWEGTPWEADIARLKDEYEEEGMEKLLRSKRFEVSLVFRSLESEGASLEGGSLRVSANAARWLGEQLMAAADGAHLMSDPPSVEVMNDHIIVFEA